MAQVLKKKRFFRNQPAMRKVLWASAAPMAGAVYFFGWRSLAMVLFCLATGILLEWIFCRLRNEPVSEAVFVTSVLFALVMPPTVGWHVLLVGMAFAIIFTKEVFGGFGRNFFNPALAGRCFVYICFPVALTGVWQPAAQGPWGALRQWSTARGPDQTAAVTSATPLAHLKAGRLVLVDDRAPQAHQDIPFRIEEDAKEAVSESAMFRALFFGRISGTMGVTSALLILIGGMYLYWTKTASRTIILTLILTYAILSQTLFRLGVEPVPRSWTAVLGGGFLFGTFFMATDPVSAPRTEPGRIIYAILIGIATVVIRNFSIFNGGLMFAILLGNMFAPIIDVGVKSVEERRKRKLKEAA
jgi:Na+-transporting NADH:ubiquinone oxidoreductase subunit B